MRTARWLSGVWILLMIALGIVYLRWALWGMSFTGQVRLWTFFWIIVYVAFSLPTAGAYGINYRALMRSKNNFVLKSIYPTICVIICLLPYATFLLFIECFVCLISVVGIFIFVIFMITLLGWIFQRPVAFLAALILAGLMATAIELRVAWTTDWYPQIPYNAQFWGLDICLTFISATLPGLWMALACFFATLLATPRRNSMEGRELHLMGRRP